MDVSSPKSSKNHSKIYNKSSKNHPWERLGAAWGRLGSSWGLGTVFVASWSHRRAVPDPRSVLERVGPKRRLEGVLGASWERLRAFGGRPGSLLGRLGASRELLGASLGLLGRFWSRCLSQKA